MTKTASTIDRLLEASLHADEKTIRAILAADPDLLRSHPSESAHILARTMRALANAAKLHLGETLAALAAMQRGGVAVPMPSADDDPE